MANYNDDYKTRRDEFINTRRNALLALEDTMIQLTHTMLQSAPVQPGDVVTLHTRYTKDYESLEAKIVALDVNQRNGGLSIKSVNIRNKRTGKWNKTEISMASVPYVNYFVFEKDGHRYTTFGLEEINESGEVL